MVKFKLSETYHSTYGNVKYAVSGEGPPLVLVHGTPWSSFNWRHIIPGLSQWFKVYYYDLLGYGKSEKKEMDVSLGVQNKILNELLDHWGLNNPIIVGHDFGGTTTLRTHLLNNRSFKKMILIDPVAIAPWGSEFFSHVNHYEKAFQGLPDYIHESVISTYVQGAMFREMDTDTLKGIKEPWLGHVGKEAFYRQIAQASQKYTDEIESLYDEVCVPTLIIWGEEDTWIPIEKGEQLSGKIPDASYVTISNAGHLVQEDQPSILLAHILKYALD
ncbi:alpha/beta fold hydrolase [Bacillus zhangzhouensis]|uniref:alpha/beta fold hydrolase n=1 Tax=Bacillus zhangzhouensis TaxID=1178540 RepID=UPI0028148A6C|nr:alpha/beta hydrolase [Bacillus zhangzhouensis]MDR0125749.1 alpha/beta hydrolase [Bacillus zhangzhouensis]